jgi:predicted ATPase/DNA-binding SARP family transcriptional activator
MVPAPNETKLDSVLLRLFLLGAFRLERDSRTVQLPTRKIESLLAYLVLHPEEHPREKLAALFWGDATDEQARTSLRTALTALRKELGEDILIADRETVQLNPDKPIWVDARAFEQLATEDSQSAIPLYHSNLLPDFYDDWIAPERERLRSLYLDTLLQLVQQARSESQYARAIELACKALASDPANEKAYQHIIFCYAAIGDRIGALKQYDECEKKLRDELGVAPSKETTALRDQIEQALIGTKSREAAFTNVPAPLTSFIGRAHAIVEIKRLIETTRLVTLVGAGGCGKTRLAIKVAADLANANQFKNGVWWVDLAPLSDATLAPQAVAAVFNLHESPETPLPTVFASYLSGKELLLVLDNCEHLIDACARLAASLLGACSKLRVLATSREPLGVLGEVAWRVPSLALPGAETVRLLRVDELVTYEAIRLFTERAEQIAPQWKLRDHALATVDTCARLDGIPLALELAAARVKALSVEQIAARLDDRFRLLTGGSRTAMPRHQTLRATMDWSYDLLSDAERALLRRLSVFAGGFTLEAVEHVCAEVQEGSGAGENAPPLPRSPAPLLDLLTALIDKSLVVVEQKGNATRYRLLETVRQYAREKLLEANESEIYSRRHRDWFLQFAEQAAPKLRGREQLEWCERLDVEMENLRAALAWSLAQTDHGSAELTMRLTGSLWWFWLLRGYWVEARTWLERSLENRAVTPARAMPLIGLAQMEFHAGTPAKGRALYEEALALYRQQGDKWGIAFAASFCGGKQSDPSKADALFEEARSIARELKDEWLAARPDIGQGMYYSGRGDLARARLLFESALDHAQRCGERWFIGNALSNLGEIARDQGDYDRATVLLTENLEVRRELGNQNSIAGQFYGLGTVAWRRQDRQQAEALFKQALALARETGYSRVVSVGLWAFGRVAVTEKRYERAARLFGAVESLSERMHTNDRRAYEDDVRALRAQLGEPVFDKARVEGRAMSLEQAIAYALEDVKNE